MNKAVLMALVALSVTPPLFAQSPQNKPETAKATPAPTPAAPQGNSKIMGVVIDEATKNPVEFATFSLVNKITGKTVDGTVSDEKGRFSLVRVSPGDYRLTVSFVGYASSKMENVTVGSKDEVNVGVLALKSDAKALDEVSVVGDKLLVEDKVDRLVYNAEKDLTNTGGTASEVLKKVPGVTVDLDGNVNLRGSSNIRVLINNKPSSMMATSVADALQQIPSDLIKSVEVITSPSAKYDAEGTAGIINIITKKNSLQGVNGVVNSTYGNRISSVNGNVGFRKGKVGLNTAFGQMWRNNPAKSIRETDYQGVEGIDRLSQTMQGKRNLSMHFIQLGADYDLSKKSSLAAGIRMQSGEIAFRTNQINNLYFRNAISGGNTRSNINQFDNLNYDINLDYSKQFEKAGQEISVLGLLSRSSRDNSNFADIFNREQQLTLREQNLNDSYNEEKTIQVDYVHPLKNKHLVEVGAKTILRYAESDFQFLIANSINTPFNVVPNRTDVFSYHQNVGAAYGSYEFSVNKKYNLKFGTRYEYTKVNGDFTSSKTKVKQEYDNVVPSVAISRTFSNNQTLKFNYTKRIQRPQLSFLNPFENRADTFNIQVGNPSLNPEIANAYEVGYSTFFKSGTSLNATFFWRQTNNSIQAYTLSTPDGVNITQFGNIGRNASYGVSLFGSTKFLKKGNLSGNLNAFYLDLRSGNAIVVATNASMVYNANLNASYVFEKGFSAQIFGQYNSRRATLQGNMAAFAMSNVAVKKDILDKKGSISVGVDNPFSATLKQKVSFRTPTIDQTNSMYIYNRQVRVSGSYKFGKVTGKSQPRRKKKINNDDAKSDDEGNAE